MSEQQLRSEIALLRNEVATLRQRMELMISRAGGRVSGTLTCVSGLQLVEMVAPTDPAADNVRMYARDSAGVTQVVVHYSDGTVDVISEH
jgi:hypothetical protein